MGGIKYARKGQIFKQNSLLLNVNYIYNWYMNFQERLDSWITIHVTKDIISTQITSFTESCIFNNIIKYQFFINLVKFTVLRGNKFVDNENKCYWYMNNGNTMVPLYTRFCIQYFETFEVWYIY